MPKTKYLLTIYFECDDNTNVSQAVQVASERLEQFDSSIKIHDTHFEEDND